MRRFLLILIMVVMLPLTGECADFNLADSSPTSETQLLANFLSESMSNTTSVLFGQQIDGWPTTDRGTIETVNINGLYPYVIGSDFNINTQPKTNVIKAHNKMGGIITMSYHFDNVVTGGTSRDETGDPVVNIITGGTHVNEYQDVLDDFADWCNTLEDKDGNLIPIIFRPFHENDGNWFWWGTDTCTDAQYIQLWQETFTYLNNTKSVHNLIWCYAPEYINTNATERYPGDSYVDICGIDKYSDAADAVSDSLTNYQDCYDFSVTHSKIYAIAEGLKDLESYEDNDYWTSTVDSILADSKTKHAAYMFFWMSPNWGPDESRSTEASDFSTSVSSGKFDMLQYTYTTMSTVGTGTVSLTTQGEGTVTIQ